MTCPVVEKWNLLSMDLLGEAETAELLAHARVCDACERALLWARRDHATLLRAFEVFDRDHDELRSELLAAVPAQLPPPRPWPARAWHNLGDLLMRANSTRRGAALLLAPAACILIAVAIFLIPGRSGLAFAQVLDRIRSARTMVCEYSSVSVLSVSSEDRTEELETRGKLSMYSDGATRAWRLDLAEPPSTQWNFPDHYVHIDADGKRTGVRWADGPDDVGAMEAPDRWLDKLLEVGESPDRELGRDTLDGRQVVGFEIAGWRLGFGSRPTPGTEAETGRSSSVRMWVDPERRLPVRLRLEEAAEGVLAMRRTTVWDHMQWDVPLEAQAFEPPPPPTEAQADQETLRLSPPTEEAFIEGLRVFAAQSQRIEAMLAARQAEMGDDPGALETFETMRKLLHLESAYPAQLDADSVAIASVRESSLGRAREIQARGRGDLEAAKRAAEEAARDSKVITEAVGPVAIFYRSLLMEDREPEYFGDSVQPGDASALLVRWKLDDRHQRVVYGDLHVETVQIEE